MLRKCTGNILYTRSNKVPQIGQIMTKNYHHEWAYFSDKSSS